MKKYNLHEIMSGDIEDVPHLPRYVRSSSQ